MFDLFDRTQRAAADLSEALPPQTPGPASAPAPPLPGPMPTSAPPQGALGMTATPPPMPAQRPGVSPLQTMPDFRSAPLQAALQGPRGQESLAKPVGFARGGLAVFGDR